MCLNFNISLTLLLLGVLIYMKLNNSSAQLDTYYQQVQDIILNKQDWVTGLLPASTAVTVHGNYTDAWVREALEGLRTEWGERLGLTQASCFCFYSVFGGFLRVILCR